MAASEELFDLCDEWGRPLGLTKSRALVHRDGDWHRSFHCWVLAEGPVRGEAHIVLQRRALDKDTWPGRWDVSVAGHYAAGEGLEGGLRELREEMGLDVRVEQLRLVARRREEVRHQNGLIDREVQDVYFLKRPVDVQALRPNSEVIAVAAIPASALTQLAGGTLPRATGIGGVIDEHGLIEGEQVEVAAVDLVPRADGYYGRVASFAGHPSNDKPLLGDPVWW